jgi:hypothetical protein
VQPEKATLKIKLPARNRAPTLSRSVSTPLLGKRRGPTADPVQDYPMVEFSSGSENPSRRSKQARKRR